jgi:hypothetical protein
MRKAIQAQLRLIYLILRKISLRDYVSSREGAPSQRWFRPFWGQKPGFPSMGDEADIAQGRTWKLLSKIFAFVVWQIKFSESLKSKYLVYRKLHSWLWWMVGIGSSTECSFTEHLLSARLKAWRIWLLHV